MLGCHADDAGGLKPRKGTPLASKKAGDGTPSFLLKAFLRDSYGFLSFLLRHVLRDSYGFLSFLLRHCLMDSYPFV